MAGKSKKEGSDNARSEQRDHKGGTVGKMQVEDTSEKVQSSKDRFTSRFSDRLIGVFTQDHLNRWTVCLFAGAAECFNTLITPEVSFRSLELTGTFCNFLGALLCGMAAALGARSAAMRLVSDAFRGGFVATFTSFCHMVEHSVSLQCSKHPAVFLYLAAAVLGGPMFYAVGMRVGQIFLPEALPKQDKTISAGLRQGLLSALLAAVVAAIGVETQLRGGVAGMELAVGVTLSMAACLFGEVVALLTMDFVPASSSVNWTTIAANACALGFLIVCQALGQSHTAVVSKLPVAAGQFLRVVADKFRSCFCGALSGYGAFSEDVAGQLASWEVDVAAANIGMNALVATTSVAFLSFATCPFADL